MPRKNNKSDQEIILAVKNNFSIAGTLRELKMCTYGGGAYYFIKSNVKRLNLDTSHWIGQAHLKGKTHNHSKKRPLSEILVENSDYGYTSTVGLKRRLLKEKLLNYHCYQCGIKEWRGNKLSLQLDHINGTRGDNRIENLRLLCPNCHSLTPTFCRKKKDKISSLERIRTSTELLAPTRFELVSYSNSDTRPKCSKCNAYLNCSKTGICKKCYNNNRKTKIEWPNYELLKNMVEQSSYVAVGKQLGVSDNAIRKRLKNHK